MKAGILTIIILVGFLLCGHRHIFVERQSCTSPTDPTATPEKIIAGSVVQNCSYENGVSDLGVGVIIAPSIFEIFNDSLLTEKLSEINMYEDAGKISFCSMFYKPDYGIMHFV